MANTITKLAQFMGLSSRNVEKFLQIVFRDLTEIEAAWLPGNTFSNLMMPEVNMLLKFMLLMN